jgi:hypothetical protein
VGPDQPTAPRRIGALAVAAPAPPPEVEASQTRWLLVVSALALGFRLFAGAHLPLDHNGAWHVFIAKNLSREWVRPPHPPFFLVLLKACDAVSHALLSYRAVPILAGVASVFLVGRILAKLGALPSVSILGALAAACAQTATVLSIEVESYTLCVFFVLACFFYYLDLVPAEPLPRPGSRIAFSGFACLALVSHYFTALFLASCVLAPVVMAAINPEYRCALRRAFPRRWAADLLTLAPPVIVAWLLYAFVARFWLQSPLNHLLPFYFHPGAESLSSFVIRNLSNTINLFAPVGLPRARYTFPLLAVFLLAVLWAPATERRAVKTFSNRMAPSIFLVLLLVLGIVLGIAGRYPFGGSMRHQFLLFVFALLSGFVAIDRLMRAVGTKARVVLAALTIGIIGADVAVNRDGYVVPPFEPFETRRGIFRDHLAQVRTVHLDQLNLIALMMEYYGWEWRYAGHEPMDRYIERYELTNGSRRLTVVAHRRWWKLDFRNPALYAELAATWSKSSDCETAFSVYQNVYGPPWKKLAPEQRSELETGIPRLASAEGLDVRRLALDDDDIYAEICVHRGPPVVSAVDPPGTAAGMGFLTQPNGESAISIQGSGFRRGAVAVLSGRPLATTFGNASWITAVVPTELYSKPKRLELRVVNPDRATSNAATFDVRP